MNVVRSLVQNVQAIQLVLEDASNYEDSAVGLFKRLTSLEFLLVLHHLLDVLVSLEVLCKVQTASGTECSSTGCPYAVQIKQCIATLAEMYPSDDAVGGKNYQEVVAELKKGERSQIIFRKEGGRCALSFEAIDANVHADVIELVRKINTSLDDRAGANHAVIQATGIFKPEIYSSIAPKELLTSGDEQLRLLSHFSSLLDVDENEAVDEFLTAKRRMKTKSGWSDSLPYMTLQPISACSQT